MEEIKKTTVSELEIVTERSVSLVLVPFKMAQGYKATKLQTYLGEQTILPQMQMYVARKDLKDGLLDLSYRKEVIEEIVLGNQDIILKRGISAGAIAFGAIGNANTIAFNGTLGTSIIPSFVTPPVRFAVVAASGINGSVFSAIELIVEKGPALALFNKNRRELALELRRRTEDGWLEELAVLHSQKLKDAGRVNQLISDNKIELLLKNLNS